MPLVWMIVGLLVIAAFVAVMAMRFGFDPSASAGARQRPRLLRLPAPPNADSGVR